MLVQLAAAILAMPSGRRCPGLTPAQAVEATNRTRAYLHSGPVREAGHALGTEQTPSDSDESAKPRLFGMLADVVCPDTQHGELELHYLDDNRIDHGPYSESWMREWWIKGECIWPRTMVRVSAMDHHVRVCDIYPMGNPPTWKPTTSLSELAQGPEHGAAASASGASSADATRAVGTAAQQDSAAATVKEKDEEILCSPEEATQTCDDDVNTPPPREESDDEMGADYGKAEEPTDEENE